MNKLLIALVIASAIGATDVVWAQDFEKATKAYDSGDYATARKIFKVLAEQGNARAQYSLGLMSYEGRGASQDYKEAAKWFRKAAMQGVTRAQYNLAGMYDKGHGVVQDYKEAAKWKSKAAENSLQ